ncbi:Hypothetical protein POVR1_LOCUS282 [uncultured virus]|nr:Hypothetical protein POVR1_LOCUS282 [uncultured virus]
MASNLLLDALIPNLSVNQLIDFYNTQRSWQEYLEDPITLDSLTKRYEMRPANSFGEFITEYDKKTIFRLCYDRHGTLDYSRCLVAYIRDNNNYAFDVIVKRYKNQIKANKGDLLSEAVRANNEHAVRKLIELFDRMNIIESSTLPGLLMRSLRYDTPVIAVDLVTYIKRHEYVKNFPNSRLKDIISQDLPLARIVSILRNELSAGDIHSLSKFDSIDDATYEDRNLSLIWKLLEWVDSPGLYESIEKSLEDCDLYSDPEILQSAIRSGYYRRVSLILEDPRIKIGKDNLMLATSFSNREILSLILHADQLDPKDVPDTLKDQYDAIISKKPWTLRRFQMILVGTNEDYHSKLQVLDNLPLIPPNKNIVNDEFFRKYYVMTNYQLAEELKDHGVPVINAIGHMAVAVLLSYLDRPSVYKFTILMKLLPICARHQIKTLARHYEI